MSEHVEPQELPADDEERELPPDDLEHYSGKWVALRDGRVVAHDPDPEQLRANPEVRDTDDIFPSASRRPAST